METIRIEKPAHHVSQITLSRPERLNSINSRMAEELAGFFEQAPSLVVQDIRAIVITGAGARAFCAGADLVERSKMDEQILRNQHAKFEQAFQLLRACSIPCIAAVNGFAYGGGFELALACDLIIASESASFALPEVKRGFIPGCGGTWFLPQRVGIARAKELLLLGRAISASEALSWGLINKMVPNGEHLKAAHLMAEELSRNAPIAVRKAKNAIEEGFHLSYPDGMSVALKNYWEAASSQDRKEGIAAFIEKREPIFRNQ